MHHSDADNLEAAKKAAQLLSAKELVDGQPYFGLYLKQLQAQSKALISLNEPSWAMGWSRVIRARPSGWHRSWRRLQSLM